MTLYQVVLNTVTEMSPIFLTREEAESFVLRFRDYALGEGAKVVLDTPGRFAVVWGGDRIAYDSIWIQEIKTGRVPPTWEFFCGR